MATYKSNKKKKKSGSSILIIIVLGVIALLAIRGLVGLITGSGVRKFFIPNPGDLRQRDFNFRQRQLIGGKLLFPGNKPKARKKRIYNPCKCKSPIGQRF